MSSSASSKSEGEIRRENQKVLDSLEPGDLVEFLRSPLYSHWAVYIGNGKIIHLAGDDDRGTKGATQSDVAGSLSGKMSTKAWVQEDNFMKVAGKSQARKNNEMDKIYKPFDGKTVVKRAKEKVGKTGYNIFSSNCEHFVNWCRYDEEVSRQVEEVWKKLIAGGARYIGTMASGPSIAVLQ